MRPLFIRLTILSAILFFCSSVSLSEQEPNTGTGISVRAKKGGGTRRPDKSSSDKSNPRLAATAAPSQSSTKRSRTSSKKQKHNGKSDRNSKVNVLKNVQRDAPSAGDTLKTSDLPASEGDWKQIGKPYKIRKRNDNNRYVLEMQENTNDCRRRNLEKNTTQKLKWKTCKQKLAAVVGKKKSNKKLSKSGRYVNDQGNMQHRVWYFDGLTCKTYVKGQNKTPVSQQKIVNVSMCIEHLKDFYKTIDVVVVKKETKECMVYSSESGIRDKITVKQCSHIPLKKVYYTRTPTKCLLKIGWHDWYPTERPIIECHFENITASKHNLPVVSIAESKTSDFYFFDKSQCMVLRNKDSPKNYKEKAPLDYCIDALSKRAKSGFHGPLMDKNSKNCVAYRPDGKRRHMVRTSCKELKASGDVYYLSDFTCSLVIPSSPNNKELVIERDDSECATLDLFIAYAFERETTCVERLIKGPDIPRYSFEAYFSTLAECKAYAAEVEKEKAYTGPTTQRPPLYLLCANYCNTKEAYCQPTHDCSTWMGTRKNCRTIKHLLYTYRSIDHVDDAVFVLCKRKWYSFSETCEIVNKDSCLEQESCHVCPLDDAYRVGLLKGENPKRAVKSE